MEKCDFLLTYEIRNREIESICLVKRELERRGYSVLVREQYGTYFEVPEPIAAEVVAVPAFYRERAQFYTASHVVQAKKILNFQWEQITTETRSKKDGLAAIKPWGFGAMHISWGEDDLKRLTEVYGVPEDHVTLTGHLSMDYLQPELRGYYLSKEDICRQYNIPEDREICLFISSFVITDITDRVLEKASKTEGERDALKTYREESIESHRIILEWFERMLSENPDRVLIYRPHPEEKNHEILREIQSRHENFRVISEMSVKQWILIADKILTWISTSIAEIYFAQKTCLVLQPVKFSSQTTMRIYENVSAVKTYDEFISALNETDRAFPIPDEDIRWFYWRSDEKMTYEIVCDVLEKMLHDDSFALEKPLNNPFRGVLNKERIKNFIKRRVASSRICRRIHEKNRLKGSTIRKNIQDVLYVRDKLKKNHVTKAEMDEIVARVDAALKEAGK